MQIKKIVVATGNAHKLEEIAKIFDGAEVLSQKQCGFDDSNLLCRHFKQGYGITPNECRKLKG